MLNCCSVVQSPLFRDSEFNISFGNQVSRVWGKSGEAQNLRCLKSGMKFMQSRMIWSAVLSVGAGSGWFTVIYQVKSQQINQTISCFHLLTNLMEMPISFSNRT